MRICVHLGVKDEIELIGPCVAHLRRIGVDEFIVRDMGSVDGTLEWLKGEESADFRVIASSNAETGEEWLRAVTQAIAASKADWVMMLDADEFPLLAQDDLHQCLTGRDADLLYLPRYNVVLGEDGPRLPLPPAAAALGRADLFAVQEPDFRTRLSEDPTAFWLRAVPVPKIIVRPGVIGSVRYGGHDVVARDGQPIRRVHARDIIVSHVGLSTLPRFARKIDSIRERFRLDDGTAPPDFAWHWRRWVRLADEGLLADEFTRSRLSDAEIQRLKAEGIVQTAAQLLGVGAAP